MIDSEASLIKLSKITFHPTIFQILGAQLVSDQLIALTELIKNSYDAEATKVHVEIGPERIIIEDNGHGMDEKDIENGWLVVGTPLKRNRSLSKNKKRILTGSMGIGRLASFSIADEIEIITAASNDVSYQVKIDFDSFTQVDDLSKIIIPIHINEDYNGSIGTKIILSNLKWVPDSNDISRIYTLLSVLVDPNINTDFTISLNNYGLTSIIDPKSNLPTPPIKIESNVDIKGNTSIKIKGNSNLYVDKLTTKKYETKNKSKYKHLKNVKITAYWYPLGERPTRQYWKIPSRNNFSSDMRNEISGVRIYRDNMRVFPYGDTDNDWLNLESTYVGMGPMSRYPRKSSLVGWVTISRTENPELTDTANREGLHDNAAYKELVLFGKDTFAFLAEYRREVEPIVSKENEFSIEYTREAERAFKRIKYKVNSIDAIFQTTFDIIEKNDYIFDKKTLAKEVENMTPLINIELKKDLNLIENYIDASKEEIDRSSLYRDKLTAGNLVAHIIHDVGSSISNAQKRVNKAAPIECDIKEHERAFDVLTSLMPRISSSYSLLKGGIRSGAQRVTKINVTEEIIELKNEITLVSFLDKKDIVFKGDIVYANMRKADLWSIVTNLLLNSLTCSDFDHAKKDFPEKRKIIIELITDANDLTIICDDNGLGLPDKPPNWIWQPFNSTRKGGGSGLGLYIISNIVTWYGGTRKALDSKYFKTGARFEITLNGVVITD